MSRSPSPDPEFIDTTLLTSVPEITATGAGAGTTLGQGIDPTLLAGIVANAVTAALRAHPAATPSTSNIGRHMKASDLPVFKGCSPDGADATSFLDALNTQFLLANTPEAQKTYYASLAFPINTPAHSWYREQRDLGLFRHHTDPPDVLRYDFFTQAFEQRFSTPIARRYVLEDSWDRFTQKGSVAEHHIKFTKLWHQLQQLHIRYEPDVVASKFLRSLNPEIFNIVSLRNRDLPDLETVHRQALEAEYQLRPVPGRSGPKLHALFTPGGHESRDSFRPKGADTRDKVQSSSKPDKYCFYHKWNNTHTSTDCHKIKDLKAKGEWKGKD